jgi:hypothetical protein
MRFVYGAFAFVLLGWFLKSIIRDAARVVLRERDERFAVDERELERNVERERQPGEPFPKKSRYEDYKANRSGTRGLARFIEGWKL